MKKLFGSVFLIIILSFSCGCNQQQKQQLQKVIEQQVQAESVYTTVSFENYLSALADAKEVMDNSFASAKDIETATESLQSALENLTMATKGVYRIEYEFTLLSNASVGNDWKTTITYNGRTLDSGDTVTGTPNSEITLQALVTEYDSIPDTENCQFTMRLKDGSVGMAQITVRENRGRYSGNTATWNVRCHATLIAKL